jgi:hypothetical protein
VEYKIVGFNPPFLAMAELKQAWLCSFGLSKTFAYAHLFSPWQSSSKLGSAHLAYRKRLRKETCMENLWSVKSSSRDMRLCLIPESDNGSQPPSIEKSFGCSCTIYGISSL